MIWEAAIDALSVVWSYLMGLFPATSVPAWVADIDTHAATVAAHVSGVGAWVPFGAATQVVVALFAAFGLALAVKVLRVIASFLTGGGGSAA